MALASSYRRELPFFEIPVVDILKLKGEDGDEKSSESQKLVDAFTQIGFCLLKNMDVVGYNREKIWEFVQWFYHHTSFEEREQQLGIQGFNLDSNGDDMPHRPASYRGTFTPITMEKDVWTCKETLDMGDDFGSYDKPTPLERADNPMMAETPKFNFPNDPSRQEQSDKFFKLMSEQFRVLKGASHCILSAIAELGGESPKYFDKMFGSMDEGGAHCMRTVMYPKRAPEDIPKKSMTHTNDGRAVYVPAHADTGGITLLQTFGFPGLELMVQDKWYQVPLTRDCLIVNVGEYLSRISNKRFKATIHRVMDIGQDRFSIPFFYGPLLDADLNTSIPRSLLPKKSTQRRGTKSDYIPFGSFMIRKMSFYTEWQEMFESLPQWMKDKYLQPHWVKQLPKRSLTNVG